MGDVLEVDVTAEGPVVRARRGLSAELNYLMPEGSVDVESRVRAWFEAAADQLAGEFISEFPAAGLPSAGLHDPAGGPFGAVGSRWCSLVVISPGKKRLATSLQPWSPKNWERCLARGGEVSVEMSAKFSTLNQFGHAGTPSLTVSAYRQLEAAARQWLTFSITHAPADQRQGPTDEVAEKWRRFLLAQAELCAPLYGELADDRLDAGTRTTLEANNATFPSDTLALTDSQVRGYSWVTITSAGVVTGLGGVAALRATGAFHTVTELPSGGAVLQATPRLSEYHGDAVRRVFEALGPVLPQKAPWPDPFDRFKLIYEAPR